MRTRINYLLGAVLSLLVTSGFTHSAAAQGDIVFYAPVIATNISRKIHTESYTTNNQILTMNADGSNVRQLTFGTQNCFHPSWRPRRTHILYFRESDPGSDLYCMNADGSGAFVVATGTAGAGVDWSPDGTMVSYVGYDATGWLGILLVNVDPTAKGKNKVGTPVLVRKGGAYAPVWSPDGTKIAFGDGGNPYITVLDLVTGTESAFSSMHGLLPSWSPTGDRLAFVSGDATPGYYQLFTVNADFSGITQVTSFDNSVFWPAWSDDGTQMVFRLGSGSTWDTASLYRLTLATGELTLLRDKGDHPDWRP